MANVLQTLDRIRRCGGNRETVGLTDDTILRFASSDPLLAQVIDEAAEAFEALQASGCDLLDLDESEQLGAIQSGLINFYAKDAVNPYASLAARGPWIVTLKGAIVHDSGGYGMLGFGHGPQEIIDVMARPHVMANVMTPNVSQQNLVERLRAEIGRSRGESIFNHFLCLNSGSEAVTVAARLSDVNAKIVTDPGGRHQNKPIRILSLKGGFHGRTDRPAQFSDSTAKAYRMHLASFRDRERLLTIAPNSIDELEAVYERADAEGFFIESFFMEPVMGEGDPGMAITPEFYRRARELTKAHGSLFLVDSIQAGLRAQGCLSIIDYPGFGGEEAPDMETYSKALNAGQYPLSVLGMTDATADLYRLGVYGNTMTTNPRAMDVACTVMDLVTDELRDNIRDRGAEFVERLSALKDELGGEITKVQGTGLLFSCELASHFKAYGRDSLEEYLRKHGIGVIHGGENSLRFTPHFRITSEEVELIVDQVRDAVVNGPRRMESSPPLAQVI